MTPRRSCTTGRFRRHGIADKVHTMFQSWAVHLQLQYGTSEGQGYSIGILQEYSGLPPHSLIPKGVEFTDPYDIAINNYLEQTTDKYREYVYTIYIEGKRISKYRHSDLLDSAANYLFR